MKKSTLYTAIAIGLSISATQVHAIDVPISVMKFGGTFAATGTLQDNPNDFGFMEAVDNFNGHMWAAAATVYFEPGLPPDFDLDLASDEANVTNGALPAIFDDPLVNGPFSQTGTDLGDDPAGGTMYNWSGKSDQLPTAGNGGGDTFSYDFTLSPNEVAWGTLFNWNGNGGIPVLVIMDCVTVPGACVGRGTPMLTVPFPGAAPKFSGTATLSCPNLFASIAKNEVLIIDKADLTSACTDATGAVTITSADGTSANGGSVADDGTTYTFTPVTDVEGPDSFGFVVADDQFTDNVVYDFQVGGVLQSNFSILDSGGVVFGGTNDVTIDWDGVTFNTDESDNNFDNITISSPEPFFDFLWSAHHIRVYDGGVTGQTLTFDTTCTVTDLEAGTSVCGGGAADMLTLDIPAGMVGAHINFDWNGNDNIDVVNVWELNAVWDDYGETGGKNSLWFGKAGVTPHKDAIWERVSIDADGDGVHGAQMIDGPFAGSYANFNYMPDRAGTPLPDYTDNIAPVEVDNFALNPLWLLASLLSVFGIRRLNKNK